MAVKTCNHRRRRAGQVHGAGVRAACAATGVATATTAAVHAAVAATTTADGGTATTAVHSTGSQAAAVSSAEVGQGLIIPTIVVIPQTDITEGDK